MLILVRSVGPKISPKHFNRIHDRLLRLQNIAIQGQQRTLQVRFKTSYPVENNEWGDFQAHRKVLGLFCIGTCDSENELAELNSSYEDIKQQYASTVFDSRLLLFGLNKEGTTLKPGIEKKNGHGAGDIETRTSINKLEIEQLSKEDRANLNINELKSGSVSGASDGSVVVKSDKGTGSPIIDTKAPGHKNKPAVRDPLNANSLLENAKLLQQQQQAKIESSRSQKEKESGSQPHVIYFPSMEDSLDLEDKVREFAAALFWVLESKRMDRSLERQDRLTLLMTPFEKKDFVGIDTDSR